MMIMSSGWIMSSPWPAELLWYIPGRLYHIIPIVFGILRESFIQHVNTCDVPGILFGILGNLKYRLCWSQTFLSFPLCWSRACFGMMIGVYGVDIHNMIFQQTWRLCYFSCEQTSFSYKKSGWVLFFTPRWDHHLQPRMNWNSVLPSWTTSRSRLGNPLGTRAFKGKSMSWMGRFHQAMFDYHTKVL